MSFPYRSALIVGAGTGISASVAARLRAEGVEVGVAARNLEKLRAPAAAIGAHAFAVDATSERSVAELFDLGTAALGSIEVVLYNAGARVRGAIAELDPGKVAQALAANAFGAFLVAQQAARSMLPHGHGAILFTGATASVKGFGGSAAFAMGKFALRGLAQSAARELGPRGIHVAHFVIDGAVRSRSTPALEDKPDSTLDPDAIAQTYLDVLRQPRSAWSQEVEVRPWIERF